MVGHLRSFVLCALLWLLGLVGLALYLPGEASGVHLLGTVEMRDMVRGAAVDQCDTNSLITCSCSDVNGYCRSQQQNQCTGQACNGCTFTTVTESFCDQTTKPWIYICSGGATYKGGCGNYYANPICVWQNGMCNCLANVDNGIACSQFKMQLSLVECGEVN